MSNKNNVVSEVVEVLSSLEVEVRNKESISINKFEIFKDKLTNLIDDYVATINECDRLNSLEANLEKFIELVGMMCSASVNSMEGLENLENTSICLEKNLNKLKQK